VLTLGFCLKQLNLNSAHKLKFLLLRQEFTERRLIAQELKQQRQDHMTPITNPTRTIHIKRYYGPTFKALVRNLPLTVTSSQLRVFLSKHGKVYSAEALFYKKTKRSQGTGLVTMSTIHAHIEDAVEALSTLFLHGYKLDVCLVKGERRRL
jgi:RNA recognition motif-containing protein